MFENEPGDIFCYNKDDFDKFAEGKNLSDLFSKENGIKPISYQIYLSPEEEAKTLQQVYFNKSSSSTNRYDKHIVIDWDTTIGDSGLRNTAYEAFFQGEKILDQTTQGKNIYKLQAKHLAQSGLTLSVESNDPSQLNNDSDEDKPIRLDSIIGNAETIRESEDSSRSNTPVNSLVTQFAANCTLSSITEIDEDSSLDDGNHKVTNNIYVNYKNSYDQVTKEVGTYNVEKFPISKKSYNYLTNKYNQLIDEVEIMTPEKFKPQLNAIDDEYIVTAILFSLSFAINSLCIFMMVKKLHQLNIYMAIFIFSCLSQGAQIANFLLLHYKKL